jgi:hypothetical protein
MSRRFDYKLLEFGEKQNDLIFSTRNPWNCLATCAPLLCSACDREAWFAH